MVKNSMRLPGGGNIDRDRPLTFIFNGRSYKGYQGDTLASALLANNIRLIGRSFKYHRPRGLMSAGVEETNALVQLMAPTEEPNVQATQCPLVDGLQAHSINCWPSVNFDIGAINTLLAPIFPAGFYYKTFMWRPWKEYARLIRRFAGLGTNPVKLDKGRYEKRHHHCEVLIVGAGPAGLSAARIAAQTSARVVLVDNQTQPGGTLLNGPSQINAGAAQDWIDQEVATLDFNPRVLRLSNSIAAGYYDHNMITVVERSPRQSWVTERFWKIRAARVILATGSIERPLVFSNNDRPGIMTTSSASTFLYRYAVKSGRSAVVITNNNSAYQPASFLRNNGVEVSAIVDLRQIVDAELVSSVKNNGIEVITGHYVIKASGVKSVTGVCIAPVGQPQNSRNLSCDLVCLSGGWNPTVHLHSQSGAKPIYDEDQACFLPGKSVQPETSAGSATGLFSLAQCLEDGCRAATEALTALNISFDKVVIPNASGETTLGIQADWGAKPMPGDKAFVDFQNDVTTADIGLAVRENFVSVEHVKRYTTAGMATDQGKSGNPNVIGHIANQLQRQPNEIGTTTYRPPYVPISFAAIAGSDTEELLIPIRRTPITEWHIKAGAAMNEAGANYRRPFWYPEANETDNDAIMRAAMAVRDTVGIYDGSPLGKLELAGDDVEQLLNLVYTNRWDNLSIGQGKFGLMLQEDGRMMDDGVTFRLDQNRYLMSTGTGTADTIYAHLERLLQTEYPQWKVYVTVVTNQWANICVCGPLARNVLEAVGTDIDLNPSNFPFLGIRDGNVAGFDARVVRVSYTGELSFEINVARRNGLAMWYALMQAGEGYGITPVGSETSAVLRIEKGFISPGTEGDNITNPFDAGIGWLVDMNKPDFIGKRALQRDQQQSFVRQHVIGLLPQDQNFVPVEGSALVTPRRPDQSLFQGHVTAACFSPNLKRSICLGLLKDGKNRMGEIITISGLEGTVDAEVTKPIFIDPKGVRMKS